MFGCKCFRWSKISDLSSREPDTFLLPEPIPQWPQGCSGTGFASGTIKLGELEVHKISKFDFVWGCNLSQDQKQGVSFYKPRGVPDGFFSLGHYCQSNKKPLRGFVLVAREVAKPEAEDHCSGNPCLPALQNPLDYTLVWSSNDGTEENFDGSGYFWLPQPPEGYKSLGFIVTTKPVKPELGEVKCVRGDLTDECETYRLILKTSSVLSEVLAIWSIRPRHRGMHGKGISVGTFFCSSYWSTGQELNIACLKNFDMSLQAMPNLDQIHAIIRHYGPTLFFHPSETYLPSSVQWFLDNGAMLYTRGDSVAKPIEPEGSNLPGGGTNDGQCWIDLPSDARRDIAIFGNLESAKLYVHVKPALGGTFTDLAMWIFCPFNGPATLKVGVVNVPLSKVGQHVGDWEHFTLRVSNCTGELWSIYFSQHSGGEWVDAYDLEFIAGNKAIVYSSKGGHASFPHPGTYIQGSSKLGIGIRNDVARSNLYVDSSTQYEIIAAQYLGHEAVSEPCWLQYMREWGPTIIYDSRKELEKIVNRLPIMVRNSVQSIFDKLPMELFKEEGPTGPKEKNNWFGDERW
ncbi:hypothetical protein H5410_047400 [Solanum commersonii]|uniref:Vacuolar protein sorting-associated protein 62 n=1 Tax=Solanum commersonii TaxID=4109 RepID=A0A9J5XIK3_SOLCO|nr:hypothetical protein H5410_047400 [Solanum commersonii]